MEGSWQIETNRTALKRILASLVAMAGIATGRITLRRSIRLAVLRILRPAEAATRRLVISMATVLPPEPVRTDALPPPPPLRGPPPPLRRGGSAAAAHARPGSSPVHGGGGPKGRRGQPVSAVSPRARASFRMLDPLRAPFRPRRRWVRQTAVPRISGLGTFDRRAPVPPVRPLPSPSDLLDAAPLARRLEALGRALEDLPGRAMRFARWQARARRLRAEGRAVRTWPLKPGRPPGGRLSTYDPDRKRTKRIREVDEILAHAHSLAWEALRRPDSS